MNKQFEELEKSVEILPLTQSEQSQIKGGMAATDEEKRKKKKKHH